MPPVMCFDNAPAETLSALAELRQRLWDPKIIMQRRASPKRADRRRRIRTFTRFDRLRTISPAAALIIAAEYERILLALGTKPAVVDVERWDQNVLDTLFEIGFFNLVFGGPTTGSTELGGDLSVLQMRSGATTDPMAVRDLVDGLRADPRRKDSC